MDLLAPLVTVLLVGAPRPPSPSPTPTPDATGPVVIFLVDNSASLPPLDPHEKRVAALQKMFGFVEGRRHRLVLFGGRREVSLDDDARYRNDGQWTDFYFAFTNAREVMQGYPQKTEFRMILLTDALLDPKPGDWEDMQVPGGADLKSHATERTLAVLREMNVPLYVILVGEPPQGEMLRTEERVPPLILKMVSAANGTSGGALAQSLSSFFDDNGLLVKKFIFRVDPQEGLKKIEPAVRRIMKPSRPTVELRVFSYVVLPIVLFLLLGLGILVRSFPGPGDMEVLELNLGNPVHVAVDRLHKLDSGGWGGTGLCLVAEAKDAAATFSYQPPPLELSGIGVNTTDLDEQGLNLLHLGLEDLQRRIHQQATDGSKEEKIYALNLEYIAQNLEASEAKRILTTALSEREKIPALEFLRAKTHLLSNEPLRKSLTDPRLLVTTYGKAGERKDLAPGVKIRIGAYGLRVKEVISGGRKDVRLVLYYLHSPSPLGLKDWLPDAIQRVFRLRRSSQRVVS
jgi:hypothetical protein